MFEIQGLDGFDVHKLALVFDDDEQVIRGVAVGEHAGNHIVAEFDGSGRGGYRRIGDERRFTKCIDGRDAAMVRFYEIRSERY